MRDSTKEIAVAVATFIIVTAIFFPVLHYPYLLADANWLIRGADLPYSVDDFDSLPGQEQGYPSLQYVALTQGRPVFAGLIHAARLITEGADSLSKIRTVSAVAVVMMGAWAILLLIWLRNSIRSPWVRMLMIIAWIVSPAFAIYVYGGPWLTPGLIMVTLAAFLLQSVCRHKDNSVLNFRFGIAMVLLIFSWALYQATPLILLGLFVVTWMPWGESVVIPRQRHFFLWAIGCDRRSLKVVGVALLSSLVAYVALWAFFLKIFGTHDLNRYSLSSIVFENLDRKVGYFFSDRLPQVLNLWTTDSLSPGLFFWMSLLLITRFFVYRASDAGKPGAVAAPMALDMALIWMVMLMIVDFPALAAAEPEAPGVPVLSYMTLGPLAFLVIAMVFGGTLIGDHVGRGRHPSDSRSMFNRAFTGILFVILLVALLQSGYRASRKFSVPLHKEYVMARAAIAAVDCSAKTAIAVHLIVKSKEVSGYKEFGWRSIDIPFYSFWLLRNILDDMGLNQPLSLIFTHPHHEAARIDQKSLPITETCNIPVVFEDAFRK